MQLAFNKQLPLAEIMGKDTPLLYDRLAENPGSEKCVSLVEEFLLKRYREISQHHRLEFALRLIKQQRGLIAVKDLKEALQVSYKSLDRWFLKYIGLTPKRFTQLTRFRNILQELDEQTNPDWMQFVLDYNFFDQAHFIKEFRQFAGVSPTEFCLSRNSEGADSNSII